MAVWLPGGFCVERCGNHLLPDPFQKKKVAVRKWITDHHGVGQNG
jgi:hypothetical protein